MNDQSFSHMSNNGTVFKGDRCDLSSGVKVSFLWDIENEQQNADFAEFAAWHAMQIWPQLNGFAGYDAIRYEYSTEQAELE